MGEQAGYVVILNISVFCEMVDKIFVSDATRDGMTVHSFIDAEKDMTFDYKLVEGTFARVSSGNFATGIQIHSALGRVLPR